MLRCLLKCFPWSLSLISPTLSVMCTKCSVNTSAIWHLSVKTVSFSISVTSLVCLGLLERKRGWYVFQNSLGLSACPFIENNSLMALRLIMCFFRLCNVHSYCLFCPLWISFRAYFCSGSPCAILLSCKGLDCPAREILQWRVFIKHLRKKCLEHKSLSFTSSKVSMTPKGIRTVCKSAKNMSRSICLRLRK